MTYIARVADNEDRKWVAEVASIRMLVEEVARPDLVNIEQIYKLVDKGIEEKTLFVVEKDGILVGTLGSFLIPNIFNPNIIILSEIFWYVLPEYRKTRAGFLLLKLFEEAGKERANEITLSILTASSMLRIDSLLERGYELEEFAFRKVI